MSAQVRLPPSLSCQDSVSAAIRGSDKKVDKTCRKSPRPHAVSLCDGIPGWRKLDDLSSPLAASGTFLGI